jgi:beta-glucanase (GH16 family)
VFSEEFNDQQSLNPSIWTYDQGDWGWGNAELQKYTSSSENVQITAEGKLVITAIRSGNTFTSGRIKTLNKFTFKYGKLEASIKVPDLRNGLWPAFWTLGNNFPVVGWPKCGEIDVMEMGQREGISSNILNQRVGSAAHWEHGSTGRATYGEYLELKEDLSTDFHKFSMEWTPEMITTYIDDKKVWAMDISPSKCPPDLCGEFHSHHFILLNMAVGGQYTGLLSSAEITASFPANYEIDYIRLYANEWTEMGGAFVKGEVAAKYDLTDCACPTSCTPSVLDRTASDSNGSHSPTRNPTPSPTQGIPTPITAPPVVGDQCVNKRGWKYRLKNGRKRNCRHVARKPNKRCRKVGLDGTTGYESCGCACP